MQRLLPAAVLRAILGAVAYGVWYVCVCLHFFLKLLEPLVCRRPTSRFAGKTVLVTTGRQAKTLHAVRALKELGCRVVVTDYQPMSASAVSTACDATATLAPLDSERVGEWVDHLEALILREKVDLVLPMSTINEALFIGVAKDWLARRLPHVQFFCEGLEMMSRLDNKATFAKMCHESGVPVPENGIVTSREQLEDGSVPFGDMDVIVKRIESSINREEEIKMVPCGGRAPVSVQPSQADPWQWQRFVKGVEYSAWFVCVEGRITFQGCYRSEADLLFFDGMPVPGDVEAAIAKLISMYRLTGQYAFDFFREEGTGRFFVIECNPRASSVLEGVSGTPGWGASFFGEDARPATQYQEVGFWFHRNCRPFVGKRTEGFWSWSDPLPILVAELAWPLEMLRIKGALKGGSLPRTPTGLPIEAGTPLTALFPSLFEALGLNYHHLDVNIGKVIVPGPTSGRNYVLFEEMSKDPRAAFVRDQVQRCCGGSAPRILCADADVAEIVAGMPETGAQVTRLAEDPMQLMQASPAQGGGQSVILGSPRSTMRNLAQQEKAFDVVFLSRELLADLPPALRSSSCRQVEMEALPPAVKGA
mmetsp:Transcript_128070/g.398873  ORF Transcript_128070/g.398873 Transcript_128070/m.398873 type:complete len:591 (+) Transcript_128070:137-1909(+)